MEPMTHTTTTTTVEKTDGSRRAAINGLAVVGFIALIFIGITLAIYAARYVPETVARLGSANVYFSSIFGNGDEDSDLEVVPGDSVPFDDEDKNDGEVVVGADDESQVPLTPSTPSTPSTPATPKPGKPTTITVPVTVPVTPYGKADLAVRVMAVGYLKSADTDSFVKDNEVPEGKRPAVKFRVTNTGTNNSGSWKFKAKLPTTSSYTFESRSQASLAPNQYVDFTLGFDRAKDGENRITITIDSDDDVNESNEKNNTLTVDIEVED